MHRTRNILRSRFTLLLALVAIFAVTLAGPPKPTAIAACPDAATVRYFSDASLTTEVGRCWHTCCQLWTCTGQMTSFYTVFRRPCDFQ